MSGADQIPALSIQHLTVNYHKTSVLWDINTDIPSKHLVAIIGPNGAGKSSLLKACMGLIKPITGTILCQGKPIAKSYEKIGFVPQRASVDWDFPITALDLVLMGRYRKLGLLKWLSKTDKEKGMAALEQLGMAEFASRQIGELSGGQQQRLFIARALLQEASIYLMDEPFAGIDKVSETVLAELFQTMRSSGKTVVIVHHDLATAERYFDWCLLLNTCLIATGPIQSTLTPTNIVRTYGRSAALLDEAAKLSQTKKAGLR